MILFYTIISILIGRVNGFFIPCESQEDCKGLDGFCIHICVNHYCIAEDYFLEDYKMPVTTTIVTVQTTVSVSTTVTAPTTVTASTTVTAPTTVPTSLTNTR